jgi:hypothetical protein
MKTENVRQTAPFQRRNILILVHVKKCRGLHKPGMTRIPAKYLQHAQNPSPTIWSTRKQVGGPGGLKMKDITN